MFAGSAHEAEQHAADGEQPDEDQEPVLPGAPVAREAGTVATAYIGSRKISMAMTGPDRDSMVARMPGFTIAAPHVIAKMTTAAAIFMVRSLIRCSRSATARVRPISPSEAPR
ncbi:hypothetical protein BJF82_02835 [Kytococcus sp. CUA-901]|nr:hypothetical protein BJF82_02835 [Kytococcus sp. CUA-901]